MSISVFQREKDLALVQSRFDELGISVPFHEISKRNYTETLTPVLLELFEATSDPMVRLEIGRRLQFSKRPEVERALLKAFVEGVPSNVIGHDSYRWGIGSLLEAIASKASMDVCSYLSIAKNASYGRSREMVVLALSKLNGVEVEDVLISLLGDGQVYGHAVMALGKRGVTKAAPLIRAFEDDSKPWIRKEVAKALRSIEKKLG